MLIHGRSYSSHLRVPERDGVVVRLMPLNRAPQACGAQSDCWGGSSTGATGEWTGAELVIKCVVCVHVCVGQNMCAGVHMCEHAPP